jgi:predicted Rossmann fold flavoprotein
MNTIVIGGGPAGMMAAIQAAKMGDQVTLLEKMPSLGRKLLITGKGRCNITSSLPIEEFIANVPGNGMFLYSSFQQFTNKDIINLIEEEGLQVKEERGHRIFPITDQAKDVLNIFLRILKKYKVIVKTNAKVEKIIIKEGKAIGVQCLFCDEEEKTLEANKFILATGGKSYPITGSTGDGYRLAEQVGHTITKIKPSLVPLTTCGESLKLCKKMQGLSLKNVKIQLKDRRKKKIIYEDFGEMLFTHWGVSGPTILSASAHLLRYPKVEDLLQNHQIYLKIDLKPVLTVEKLEERVLRDFTKFKNKEFKNSLDELLPKKMIESIVEITKIEPDKKVNAITKQERLRLVELLKDLELEINGFRPIEEAIITSGGVSIKEINPKTMESKIIEGLYFAGEVIDVDAYTGGFNLQIAYSTGYAAGSHLLLT